MDNEIHDLEDVNLTFQVKMAYKRETIEVAGNDKALNFVVTHYLFNQVGGEADEIRLFDSSISLVPLPANNGIIRFLKLQGEYVKEHLPVLMEQQVREMILESEYAVGKQVSGIVRKDVAKQYKALVKKRNTISGSGSKRVIVGDARNGRRARCNLTNLIDHVEAYKKQWKDAEKIYKSAMDSEIEARKEEWQEHIEKYHPDLPQDLVQCLDSFSGLDASLADMMIDKGWESTAEDIALLHAARLCGANLDTYKKSSLLQQLGKQMAERERIYQKQNSSS